MPDPPINPALNPYGLSDQDRMDLAQVRNSLPADDPRRAKIEKALGLNVLLPGVRVAGTNSAGQPIYAPEGPPQPKGGPVGRFLSSFGDVLSNAGKGIVQTLNPNPQTPEEDQIMTTQGIPGLIFHRAVVAPAVQQGKQAIKSFPQSKSLAAGHALAATIPLAGPWAAQTGEQVGTQIGQGDIAGAMGTGAGNVALAAAPKVLGKVASVVPKVARGGADIIAGTGKAPVRDLVADIQTANTRIAEGNAKAAQAHLEDTQNALHDTTGNELQYQQALKQKAADIQAQRLAEQTKHAQESTLQTQRESALNHVTSNADAVRTKLNQTYENAKAVADEKYNNLREALGNEEANPKRIQDAFLSAAENLQDSNSLPPVMKMMERNLKEGPLDYSDLQGIRTKLGEAMKPGKMLPADVHFAYKGLLDDISNEMAEIGKRADEAGPHDGPSYADQLKDAQGYYRNFADTFYSRKSPIRRAMDTPDPTMRATQLGKMGRFAGEDKPASAALGVYDPEAAQMAQTYSDALNTAKGIKSKKVGQAPAYTTTPEEEASQTVPQNARVAPPERPVETPKQVINPPDIQQAKTEAMAQKAQRLRGGGQITNSISAFDAIRNVFNKNPKGAVLDIGARGVMGMIRGAEARLLENPAVIRLLTEPTAKDIAAIPPDLRGPQLGQLLQAARAKGIKVHPAFGAVAGMAGQSANSATQPAQ